MSEESEEIAIVEVESVQSGSGGCYARTYDPSRGSVTFALHPNVWNGGKKPTAGDVVALSEFRYKRNRGWRAECARAPTAEEIKKYTGEANEAD